MKVAGTLQIYDYLFWRMTSLSGAAPLLLPTGTVNVARTGLRGNLFQLPLT